MVYIGMVYICYICHIIISLPVNKYTITGFYLNKFTDNNKPSDKFRQLSFLLGLYVMNGEMAASKPIAVSTCYLPVDRRNWLLACQIPHWVCMRHPTEQ